MNLYEILGINKTATYEEIKKAYRKLSMEHHPDAGGKEEKFIEINLAYTILSDSNKRKIYDEEGIISDDSPEHWHNVIRSRVIMLFDGWLDSVMKGQTIKMERYFEVHIVDAITKIDESIRSIKNIIEKLKDIREKVTCKSEVNLLHSLVDEKIKKLQEREKMSKSEKDVMIGLKEAVKDYEFKEDDPEEFISYTIRKNSSTGTFSTFTTTGF